MDVLNGLSIQVVSLNNKPTPFTCSGDNPWYFQSALARLTGAVDSSGEPFVFRVSTGGSDNTAAIGDTVKTTLCYVPTATAIMRTRMRGLTIDPVFQTTDDDISKYSNYVIFE